VIVTNRWRFCDNFVNSEGALPKCVSACVSRATRVRLAEILELKFAMAKEPLPARADARSPENTGDAGYRTTPTAMRLATLKEMGRRFLLQLLRSPLEKY
jgi:hypothetical protein